jgi:hypothetical protein
MEMAGNEESGFKSAVINYDDDANGLLVSRYVDSSDFAIYEYDGHGRAVAAFTTSGDNYAVAESEACPGDGGIKL